MFDTAIFTIAATIVGVVLVANIVATRMIARDSDSETRQKSLQLAFVWLIPLIGAIIVFGVHRPLEKPLGKYGNPPDPGDEFRDPARSASNRAGNSTDAPD